MPDINLIHFANFFNRFTDPATEMLNGELAFNNEYRLTYKDDSGVIHLLPSIDDYANLYNPNTFTVTQTAKDAVIGVGAEGDYSANVTVSLPNSCIITATGIHERQVLIHYDSTGVIKDVLPLPEYFCKLDTYADEFDINAGIIKEIIKSTKIDMAVERTALTNNAIFKVMKLETNVVATSFGYPLTTEANKDNATYQNYIYIGADNYLYIIKSLATTELVTPYVVFNKRTASINIKFPTAYFLFTKNDTFKMKTYRRFAGAATDISQELISSSESCVISEILKAAKITSREIRYEPLSISANGKSIEGLETDITYDIIVSTTEVKSNPTLVYKLLNITNGFLAYLYSIMKHISNNSTGATGLNNSVGALRHYIIPYKYTSDGDGITEFVIPIEYYEPLNNDAIMLFYKDLTLELDTDYTINASTNVVTLINFTLSVGDIVSSLIFKYPDINSETAVLSNLQTAMDSITAINQRLSDIEARLTAHNI